MNNMTIKTRNILIILIVSFICLLIGGTVIVLTTIEKREERELEEKYAALESELSPLKRERNALSNELITIDSKLEGKGYDLGSAFIMITDPYSYFLDDMYPYLSSNGYYGIISIGASYFINNDGMMTPDQITGLVEHEGYELSMSVSLTTNVQALYDNFSKKSLPNPTIAYIQSKEYTNELIESIKGLGIKTIVTYNGDAKIEDDIFYIKAYGSYEENTKEVFSNAVDSSIPLSITIGYINTYEKYSPSNFSNMLQALLSYEDQFPIRHTDTARARYQEYLDKVSNEKEALLERREVVVSRLEELKIEIARRSN